MMSNDVRFATQMYGALALHGGFTLRVQEAGKFDLLAGPCDEELYIVGGLYEPMVIPSKDMSALVCLQLIQGLLKTEETALFMQSDPFVGFGAWVNGAEVVLEPVQLFSEREVAEVVARDRDQLAYYSLATGETVTL